jgi:hypothetical protein
MSYRIAETALGWHLYVGGEEIGDPHATFVRKSALDIGGQQIQVQVVGIIGIKRNESEPRPYPTRGFAADVS